MRVNKHSVNTGMILAEAQERPMNIWWDQFQKGRITVPYRVIKA